LQLRQDDNNFCIMRELFVEIVGEFFWEINKNPLFKPKNNINV